MDDAIKYLDQNLGGGGKFWLGFGFLLFLTTTVLSGILAFDSSYSEFSVSSERHYYAVVFAFTILTCLFAFCDFNYGDKNGYTVMTVFFGSIATLFSVGLWSCDGLKEMSTGLVFVQCAANAIQLSAIFNTARKQGFEF